MKNEFVIFRSPNLRFRKEEFGGVVRLRSKTLIVNKKQYDLIDKVDQVTEYRDLIDIERKIVDKLIENNIFLKVDLEKAKELGFKRSE